MNESVELVGGRKSVKENGTSKLVMLTKGERLSRLARVNQR